MPLESPWFAAQQLDREAYEGTYDPQYVEGLGPTPVMVPAGWLVDAYEAFLAEFRLEPSAMQWAVWLRDVFGIAAGSGEPLSEQQVQPLLQALHQRYTPHTSRRAASGSLHLSDHFGDGLASAWRSNEEEHASHPVTADLAADVGERDLITGEGSEPIREGDTVDVVGRSPEREGERRESPAGDAADTGEEEAEESLPQREGARAVPVGAAAQGARQQRGPRVNAPSTSHLHPRAGAGLVS